MSSEFLTVLSHHLKTALDIAGASEYVRRTRQDNALMTDALTTLVMILEEREVGIYTFGSSSEGTTTPGLSSDTDYLMCFFIFPVIEMKIKTSSNDQPMYNEPDDKEDSYILMLFDNNTPLGYTKLALIADEATKRECFKMLHPAQDANGIPLMTHAGIVEAMTHDEVNGPAATSLKLPGFTDLDYIPAFMSTKWPQAAGEFLTRERVHDFPSKDVKSDFGELGIFLVPTGQSESPEQNLQWRLSFSLQERKIMMNLNETQHKCYILLKMLKRDFIKPLVPGKSLTSYHCKTSMFFVMEKMGNSVWIIDNLVECLIECVRLLWSWVSNAFIPSYFIPSVNLWKGNNDVRCKVQTILEDILQDVPKSLMSLQCDKVGELLHKFIERFSQQEQTFTSNDFEGHDYFKLANRELHLAVHRLHYSFISETLPQSTDILLYTVKENDLDKCVTKHKKWISVLKNTPVLRDITSQEATNIEDAITFILPFMYSSLGSQLATKAMLTSDESMQDDAMTYLYNGKCSDVLAGNVKLAAVLYAQKKYNKCLQLLEDLDNNLRDDVITISKCRSARSHTMLVNESLVNKILNEKPTSKDVLLNNVATCVQFLPTEIPLIPKDLQYEMFRSFGSETETNAFDHGWYDIVAIDSKVLLYYLMYRVHEQLGNEREKEIAFVFLNAVLEYDYNLCHHDTACNIIGCILREMGHPKAAFSYFFNSWRRRPDHNATKWHAIITCFEFFNGMHHGANGNNNERRE